MLGKKPKYPAAIIVMEAFLCSLLASGCISEAQRTGLKEELERRALDWERNHAESPRGVPGISADSMALANGELV